MWLRSRQDSSPRRAALVAAALFCVAGGCSKDAPKTRARPSRDAAVAAPQDDGNRAVAALTLPEASAPQGGAKTGGSLRVHLESEPPHLNPLLDNQLSISRVVNGLVYETLLECRGSEYLPGLAESWEIASDGMRLTVRLRPGVRWHDDTPLTAVDVQASFEPILRSNTRVPVLRSLLADVEAVEILPERTVRLRLLRPSPLTLRALCEVPILPGQALRAGTAPLAQLGRHPVGTGPLRFVGWERGKRIRLARAWPGTTPPYFDEVVFEIDSDGGRALSKARRGQIDVLPRVLEVHHPEQVTRAALRDVVDLYRLTPDRYSFLVLNHARPPLGDVRFRRALSLLWDRSRRAEEVHRGLARPIAAPTFGNVPVPPFDRQRAITLLEEGGYRDTNGDGVREIAGTPIRLTLLQAAGSRSVAAESRAFAHDLRRAGLLLDVVSVDPTTLLGRLKQGEFHLAPMLWEGRRDDDPRPLYGPGAPFNFSRHRDDRLYGLLEDVRTAATPGARAVVLQRLAEFLASEVPVLFLYRHDVAALIGRQVRGVAASGDRLDLRHSWIAP